MKIRIESNRLGKLQSFKGYELRKDENGDKYYSFSYPYDSNKYDCNLELFWVARDENGDYGKSGFRPLKNSSAEEGTDPFSYKMKPGENRVYLKSDYRIPEDAAFAYHYSLVPKGVKGAVPIYKVDAGDLVGNEESNGNCKNLYNLVVPLGNMSEKAGAAILIFADNFDPRWMYDKQGNIVENPNGKKNLEVFKNFGNSIGGSLAGVHKGLLDGKFDLYNRIFTLPLTSGDKNTGYWLESGFQLTPACGNVDNYEKFQRDLFIKGKNLVLDSPFTSEGLNGIHVQSILKYGEDDVFFDWFNCKSLKDMTAKIGAFGKRTKYIRHRLVNAPFVPQQDINGVVKLKKRKDYDPTQPTYVQIYNSDQVTEAQVKDGTEEIFRYERPDGSNPLGYGTHNDTVFSYSFPIDPKEYEKNIKNFNEYNSKAAKGNKVRLDSYEATRMLTKFSGFEFEDKIPGGFYNWNSMVDMNQFDYTVSNEFVLESMNVPPNKRQAFFKHKIEKNAEVLDYAASALKYWTKKTNTDLNLYVAQTLKGVNDDNAYEMITNLVEEKKLPNKVLAEVNEDVVDNVMNDEYTLRGGKSDLSYSDTVIDGLMNLPLESLEFGKDVSALLSTPYVTNRASAPEYIGKSRFELLCEDNPHLLPEYRDIYDKATKVYTGPMLKFANDILEKVNSNLPADSKLYRGSEVTDYGKYVLPILTNEIAKFAVVKALAPDVKVHINKDSGKISYDYDAMKKVSLKSLDMPSPSQKENVRILIDKIDDGLSVIPQNDKDLLVKSLGRMLDGTNVKSFELAEMIVDRTRSGVDWRIDAAKDFAKVDSVKDKIENFETIWEQSISILRTMTDAIREANPNSYIVAEVTDEIGLHKLGNPNNSERFYYRDNDSNPLGNRNDLVRKFLREAKVDATANYTHFFNGVPGIFARLGENGADLGLEQGNAVFNMLGMFSGKFLYSGPYNSIINSYTFADNHDKPRLNHTMSMDMGFFYANLSKYDNYEYRKRAYTVLNPDKEATPENINSYDFSYISAKAAARGESLNSAFYKSVEELAHRKNSYGNDFFYEGDKDKIRQDLKRVVADFVAGNYLGKNYEADIFGVEEVHKVIQLVIDGYARKNPTTSEEFKKALFDETFKQILNPVLSNALAVDKFMINLPGIPTTFAGDDLGSTGYETKTWNVYQKNRSAVRNDWGEKEGFIKDRKDASDKVKLLRSRPATHALNDGAPYLLKLQKTKNDQPISALYRYASDGSSVISLFNTAGTTHTYDQYSDPGKARAELENNRIDLSMEGSYVGLHGGLPEGTKFVNANDKNDVYYVYKGHQPDEYYLAKEKECKTPIILTDNTLTLYNVSDTLQNEDDIFMEKVREAKENKVSFCGSKVYENKIYNVFGAGYRPQSSDLTEKVHKFEIVSR